tara:strand:- start:83 stop:382 length:300 start_codon:yes stop_codon:yes gene_type:complete
MGYNRVNPPKQVKLPPEVEANPQLRKAFDDAYFIMFQMWKRMGGGADWIDSNSTSMPRSVTLSSLFDIRKQIGSGKPVTIDTTGFTIDTTEQTTDKTEV